MVSNSVVSDITLKNPDFVIFYLPPLTYEVTTCDKFSRRYAIVMKMTSYIEILDPLVRF